MKKNTFKALSILLAAVLLLAALPVAAFAEEVSPCATPSCEHVNTKTSYTASCFYLTNEEHLVTLYVLVTCSRCNKVISCNEEYTWFEPHTIDPSVDEETELEGECVDCGGIIAW